MFLAKWKTPPSQSVSINLWLMENLWAPLTALPVGIFGPVLIFWAGEQCPTQTAKARPTALLPTKFWSHKTQIRRAGSAAYVFANVRDLIGGDWEDKDIISPWKNTVVFPALSVSVDKLVVNIKFIASTDSSPCWGFWKCISFLGGRALPYSNSWAMLTALLPTNFWSHKTQIRRAGSAAHKVVYMRYSISGDWEDKDITPKGRNT
jgi:hypothetical protein